MATVEKANGIEVRERMGDIYISTIEWGYAAFITRETIGFCPINEYTVTFYDPKNNTRKETFKSAKAAILAARDFCTKGAVTLKFKKFSR